MSPEERELAAHPKEAGFYKKELNAWNVTQKLFKQEMDNYDKEQQQKKGVQHSIKYRTGHVREWFNSMTPAHQKEVEEVRNKWNREGVLAESQTMYRKKNLKKALEDFTEQMCHTMVCRLMMLVSHKKNSDQTLSVKIHKSQPVNHKKPFSQNSQGSKEWMSGGFEKFAEWSKAEFYPTNDDNDSSDEESNNGKDAMPEVVLDRHRYAKLPSRMEVGLKGQQGLVWQNFYASYKVFTDSMKPVPWLLIAGEPSLYLDPNSISNGFIMQDLSHLRAKEINKLWSHWKARDASNQKLIIFIGAVSAHRNKSLLHNAVYVDKASAAPTPMKHLRQLANDTSKDSSDDNSAPLAGPVTPASVSQEDTHTPATIPIKDQISFLWSLSSNNKYLLFILSIGGLKKEQSSKAIQWLAWVTWS
ncbi:uncharacterized protein EDB93DRAFT_1249003 [Suillus bovinus]|uniref:uncharacterized protein n=1 Tax=Suillus bovinus TaxID=48563 RepID=UPI001B87CF81|nr:uncharacterized protein EDB93DRAFT_1249003 [Suillus bovinus]KAG2153089.1 hypothetical protein EDB93DRAFT_1249003 [Suillus bovinus]